jgi:hypothetical protein
MTKHKNIITPRTLVIGSKLTSKGVRGSVDGLEGISGLQIVLVFFRGVKFRSYPVSSVYRETLAT